MTTQADEITLTVNRIIAMFNLMIVPNYTVADYCNAASQPNHANNSQVSECH
jgi:hypothetical protein